MQKNTKYLYDIRRINQIFRAPFFLVTYKSALNNSLLQYFYSPISFFSFSFPFSNFFSFAKRNPLPSSLSNESLSEKRSSTRSFVRVYLRSTIWREARAREGRPGVCVCALVKVHASSYLSRVLMRTEAGFSPLFLGFASFHDPSTRLARPPSRPLFHPSCSLPRPARAWCARAATGLFWFTECRVCRARASCVC